MVTLLDIVGQLSLHDKCAAHICNCLADAYGLRVEPHFSDSASCKSLGRSDDRFAWTNQKHTICVYSH